MASKTTAEGSAPACCFTRGDPRPVRPDLELLDGGGPERVGRHKEHILPLALRRPVRQLADGGRFPGAVHPDDHDDKGASGRRGGGRRRAGHEDLLHGFPEDLLEEFRLGQLLALHLFLHPLDQFVGKSRSDIGNDEGLLDVVVELLVDDLRPEDQVVHVGEEKLLRLLQPRLQLVEKSVFFAIEQSHRIPVPNEDAGATAGKAWLTTQKWKRG
jgi:hypothetical protein